MDLSPYKSGFNNLSTEDTPAGQLILLEGHRVLIPLLARQEILTTLHKYHSTYDSMFRLARNSIFWPTMKQDLSKLYDSCNTCQIIVVLKLNPHLCQNCSYHQWTP